MSPKGVLPICLSFGWQVVGANARRPACTPGHLAPSIKFSHGPICRRPRRDRVIAFAM
jgi:hypothetical protein